jgi:ribosomal protein L29
MPRAPARATLDVRAKRERDSSLHKQAGTGVRKNTVPKNTVPKNIARTNTILKNTALKSIDPTKREGENANLRQWVELSFRRPPGICWMN